MPRKAHGEQGPKRGRKLISLPSVPAPDARRAVSLCIPDDPEWRTLFWGHLSKLGWWMQYERDEQKRGKPTADVWRDIISASLNLADDEVCDAMAQKIKDAVCDAVALCIEPIAAARHAELLALLAAIDGRTVTIGDYVVSISNSTQAIQQATTNTTYNTYPPSAGERNGTTPIAETVSGDASDAEFYGICLAIVNGIVEAHIDWFESLEALSNALEFAQIVADAIPLPILSDIGDAAAAAAAVVDFVQEVAFENFIAADTTPRRLALADLLYCKGKADRAITMPILGEALAERYLGDIIDWNDPIGSLANLATTAVTPEVIYYMTLGIGLAVWTVTGDFNGLITRGAWRYWVSTGRNNPQSPQPDCGDEPPEDWDIIYDFRNGWNGFTPVDGGDGLPQGVYVPGHGILPGPSGAGGAFNLNISRLWGETTTVSQVVIEIATDDPQPWVYVYYHLNEPSYEISGVELSTVITDGVRKIGWTGNSSVTPSSVHAVAILPYTPFDAHLRRILINR